MYWNGFIKCLDGYEEFFPLEPHKSVFVREMMPVKPEGGLQKRAWVYLYNGKVPGSSRIPSGDYRHRLSPRQNRHAPGPETHSRPGSN